jgi:4-hydroxy-3-methylbut-2-en-1-yl diphosphate reductase
MEIILAQPRGFCAGVKRAIEIVERALELYGPPIYVRHEIVHNKYVVEDLKAKGVIFVDDIAEIPEGAITIFSAHGVSKEVEEQANIRHLPVIDATCPLVTKVHREAIQSEAEDRQIILIGHAGHPEVEGTSGRVSQDVILVESVKDLDNMAITSPDKLAYVTQTTLSVDDTKNIINALKERYPSIKGPGLKDICYATQNRQNAVRYLAKMVDIILVIGAQNSSNSNRLRDLGTEIGTPSYLIDDASSIDLSWFKAKDRVGITAGASAPETLVENIINFLKKNFDAGVTIMDGIEENIIFKLPKEVTSEGMWHNKKRNVG